MSNYQSLLDHIAALRIIDTHEHLPVEADRPAHTDVLEDWLPHYFNSDLVSAGISAADLAFVRDSSEDLAARWARVAPYWHAAESTGYGRSLALAARDLYGVEPIGADTIEELDLRFRSARAAGGHYDRVLREQSRIDLCVVDAFGSRQVAREPFVFAVRADDLICPSHASQMRHLAEAEGLAVHTLADWVAVIEHRLERLLSPDTRNVCLKCGLAYLRSLRFDKTTTADAERAFVELFADPNQPPSRPPIKVAKPLQDYLMHAVCRLADAHGWTYQIHTGIQEGNGNVIVDSNPTLLTNLLLEYRHVKFDLFHMGYPYVMELGNLAKNFPNAFIDMCWGHIISPEAARRALVEWLDAVPANKIMGFGGDYCFVDGVYGHQYLARHNVAASLAQKVDDGSISLTRAKELAGWIFVDNPRRLFPLDRFLKPRG